MLVHLLILSSLTLCTVNSAASLNSKCRDLLACAIKKNCVKMDFVVKHLGNGENVNAQMYHDLDDGIDYGCVFTTGCLNECNRCPLCVSSKVQLIDVLSGSKRKDGDECKTLVNCASECVINAHTNFTLINHCLRYDCAYHCFDGSCNKCSAFITRIFNQICVSGDLKKHVVGNYKHCYEIFRDIVYAKFEADFKKNGKKPAIGLKNSA